MNYFLKDKNRIEEKLNFYLDKSPFLPDLIVHVRLDPSKSFERINNRKAPRPLNLEGLNTKSSIIILNEIDFLINKLSEIAFDRGIKVINIDSDKSKRDLFSELNYHFKLLNSQY